MKKTYLVGGAVRDQLMNKESNDLDYVVVGSSPEEMIAAGFEQVGADFPVFLHPETRDEYALARTERKTGNGYNGFDTYFGKEVTIEEDLLRRDLTINAIALSDNGEIVDPYHGRKDIKNKILRHVSDAFKDDPLRILRVARFSARYPDFLIASETMELMREIHDAGETKYLTKERIWKELSRAIIYPKGSLFFNVLQNVGLGKELFPLMAGFNEDRNCNFSIFRVQTDVFDRYLENSTLKERIAHWSIPTDKPANLNIVDMWKNIGASGDVLDHVQISCSLWNDMVIGTESLKQFSRPDLKLFDLINRYDGFRRTERFLDAYDTVKNHFVILSNNKKCLPDRKIIDNWIKLATPSKEETKNLIDSVDKADIATGIKKLKERKWKDLDNLSKKTLKIK